MPTAPASTLLPEGPRPRDFVARIRRRQMHSLRRTLHRPARLRQKIAGIAAIALMPGLLAITGWGDPRGIVSATAQDGALPAPHPVLSGAALHPAIALAPMAALPPPPGVAAGLVAGTPQDHWRALQCLTAAIYYEAAREPDEGQQAVAQVVLNRVAHPAFPKTVCGVVYQGSERPGCQFSFACDGSLARKPMKAFWDRARRVAADALAGNVYAPVGLATHYHTTAVHPYWAPSLAFIGTIGAHRFYNWAGAAGKPSAFTARYAGSEPIAAPHPRTWTPSPADISDPLALEKAFEAGKIAAAATIADAPAPAYAAPLLQRGGDAVFRAQSLPGLAVPGAKPAPRAGEAPASGSGSVLPGHEGASQWIAQPGA